MVMTYILYHWKFTFDAFFFSTVNKGEPALVYMFVVLLIACLSAGMASVDGKRAPLAQD